MERLCIQLLDDEDKISISKIFTRMTGFMVHGHIYEMSTNKNLKLNNLFINLAPFRGL